MDGIEWKQYDPPEIGETVKRQDRRYNSASISVFVRSLMAKEWARALGKKPVRRKPLPQPSTHPGTCTRQGINPIGRGEKDGLYGSR